MKNRRFRLLPGSVVYFIFLIYSLILTQLLKNRVSGALFIFVLILPLLSFIHCMIGRSAIQIFVESDVRQTEKNAPLDYEIKVVNTSILSYPFVEAVVSEPSDNAVKCTKKRLVLSFVPYGSFTVKSSVRFRYRGYYEIGVESLYISDLFRLFAIRADKQNYAPVTVYPRKMTISGEGRRAVIDAPSPAMMRDLTAEKNEIANIRNYIPGDQMRDVHWKLSSKTQDLMVKQYSSVEDRHVYIFCDMAKSFVPPKKRDSYDEYASLKKYVDAENSAGHKKRLQKNISESKDKAVKDDAASEKGSRHEVLTKKKIQDRYLANIKSGMSEAEAETVRTIDELIYSGKRRLRRPKADKRDGADDERSSDLQSDLDRILSLTKPPETEKDDGRRYGGRVREDFADEYDECCLDAVVERALAEALSELRSGCVCTVAWFDDRADNGVFRATLGTSRDFEDVFANLGRAGAVSSDKYVAKLTSLVTESTNVTIKIVTSNIDPQSASLIGAVPSRFGGAGTGCTVEVITYSPSERYEDPALRAVYTADVETDFRRCGIVASKLDETAGSDGIPVFTRTAR